MPAFGLANAVTGFATLFAGATCLLLTRLVADQPRRWRFVYWNIVVTGVFTVTLHGFGEAVSGPGPPWMWRFLDTGSNIVVAWAVALAALGDAYRESIRRWAVPTISAVAGLGLLWHLVDSRSTDRTLLVPLGEHGGFRPGESVLILLSLTAVALFYARRDTIAEAARPLLRWVVILFSIGLVLATASNDRVDYPFLAWHALWHLVGAFAFIVLWAFNHVRFGPLARPQPERV